MAAVLAVAAPPAGAALDRFYSSTHYRVQYTTAAGDSDAITNRAAINFANAAERARALYVDSWGYPRPKLGRSGKTLIQVTNKLPRGAAGVTRPGSSGAQPVAYIQIKPRYATRPHVMAHEVFHTIQYAMYRPLNRSFLSEATANWATAALYPTSVPRPLALTRPELPLDCNRGTCPNGSVLRYGQWAFFQYLSHRFGRRIVFELYRRAAVAAVRANDRNPHLIEALSGALRKRGASLRGTFSRYAAASLRGGAWIGASFAALKPKIAGTLNAKANRRGGRKRVRIDHLASAYLTVKISAVSDRRRCARARLRIRVRLPRGVSSRPRLALLGGSTFALKVSKRRRRATLNRRVNACSAGAGTLVLPNASISRNNQRFRIRARVG